MIEKPNSILNSIALFHLHSLDILCSLLISGRRSLAIFSKQIAHTLIHNLSVPVNSLVKESLYKCCASLFDCYGSSLFYISSRKSIEKDSQNENSSFVYQLLEFVITDIFSSHSSLEQGVQQAPQHVFCSFVFILLITSLTREGNWI